MKYINSNVLLNFENLSNKKFAWLLLGFPSNRQNIPATITASGSPFLDVNNNNKMKIKDYSVAGISFVDESSNMQKDVSDPNNIMYIFPQSGKETTIFCNVSSDQSPNIGFTNVKELALVTIEDGIYATLKDGDNFLNNKIRETFFCFDNDVIPESGDYEFIYKSAETEDGHYRLMNGVIKDVILVYGVTTSSDDTPVNNMNYTGFTVGTSQLTISGLYEAE